MLLQSRLVDFYKKFVSGLCVLYQTRLKYSLGMRADLLRNSPQRKMFLARAEGLYIRILARLCDLICFLICLLRKNIGHVALINVALDYLVQA